MTATKTKTRWYRLHAVDTWFFRDGRPFNQDDPGAAAAESLFPPSPDTVVGALRAALARELGWNGASPWDDKIKDRLGDGRDLGALRFGGPWLSRDSETPADGYEMLVPVPSHLVAAGEKILRYGPGAPVTCDLGTDIRLPSLNQPATEPPESLHGSWMPVAALANYLIADKVKHSELAPIPLKDLVTPEDRTGVNTLDERGLFFARHVRPKPTTALLVRLEGPEDLPTLSGAIPLGGEHRAAWVSEVAPPSLIHSAARLYLAAEVDGQDRRNDRKIKKALDKVLPSLNKDYLPLLITTTPVRISPDMVRPGGKITILGKSHHLMTLCAEKPRLLGGWHMGRPVAMRACLPPGAVFYLDGTPHPDLLKAGEVAIGDDQDLGFGHAFVGLHPVKGR